jgi:hypothetical protein
MRTLRRLPVLILFFALAGCASHPPVNVALVPATAPSGGLTKPIVVPALEASCVPPEGWAIQPIKEGKNHVHQLWLSPTGNTAYGVIRFALPFPVGPDTILWFFLREMREREGEARLISKRRDARLKGLRFVAEGGLYVVRTNLTTRGFRGWAVYAGTLRHRDILPNELNLAELARENTETGVDANHPSATP